MEQENQNLISFNNPPQQTGKRNPKEPFFYGATEMPQPYVACIGEVDINGNFLNVNNSVIKVPSKITVVKTSNSYKITHKLGLKKYTAYITPVGSTPVYYAIQKNPSELTVNFNAASGFSFVIIAIS